MVTYAGSAIFMGKKSGYLALGLSYVVVIGLDGLCGELVTMSAGWLGMRSVGFAAQARSGRVTHFGQISCLAMARTSQNSMKWKPTGLVKECST
jgi:hypothetical protein